MTVMDKTSHAAERKAFEAMLDALIKKARQKMSVRLPTILSTWFRRSTPAFGRRRLSRCYTKLPVIPTANGRITPNA